MAEATLSSTKNCCFDEIDNMQPDELAAALLEALNMAWDGLALAASIIRVFNRNGWPIEIHNDLLPWARRIASGQLDDKAARVFGARRLVLDKVSRLPREIQRQLADAGTIPLAVEESGKLTCRRVPIFTMTRDQLSLAIDGDRVRPEEEQIAKIESMKLRALRIASGQECESRNDTGRSVVMISLDEQEMRRFKARAKKAKMDFCNFGRKILSDSGII